jgi:hypothetical protein
MYSVRGTDSTVVYHDAVEREEIRAPRDQRLGLIGIREACPVTWPNDFRTAFALPIGARPLHDFVPGRQAGGHRLSLDDRAWRWPCPEAKE